MEFQADITGTLNACNGEHTKPCSVSRQDILNFPFPYKLWFVVNLEFCDFLRWNRDGTIILLDISTLEDYLISHRSIFKIKNCSTFLEHLKEFAFKLVNTVTEQDEYMLLQYKHEHFLRHRIDLLPNIRRSVSTSFFYGETPKCNKPPTAAQRMQGDLCFMTHGCISKIQKNRIRHQTVLNFVGESKVLQNKLLACDRLPKDPNTPDAVIELPVELFENPHDSVLFMEDCRSEYAGYFGNCSKDQIMSFFGDYLPMYAQQSISEDGTVTEKRLIAEVRLVMFFFLSL